MDIFRKKVLCLAAFFCLRGLQWSYSVNDWPYGGGRRHTTMPDLDDLESMYLAPFMKHYQVSSLVRCFFLKEVEGGV